MTDSIPNSKPADQLHDIRQRINELRNQEDQLRCGLIAGDLPLEGDDFVVVIDRKKVERVDLDAMRRRVAEEVWKPFLVSRETIYVNCRKRQP